MTSTIARSEVTECQCRKCLADKKVDIGFGLIPVTMTRMIVCMKCGNKRCPHATNHELACTGSNEPGQKGSHYE